MKISSLANDKIKKVMQLQTKAAARKKEGQYIVEGIKMYMEIPENQLVSTYISENFLENIKKTDNNKNSDNYRIREKMETRDYYVLPDKLFREISDTVTPQGILAVVKTNRYKLSDIFDSETEKESADGKKKIYVVLEGLQDPGNLGTIIRTAEGAGVSAIIMDKKTVDVYNPKVIRSTMGSLYRVPFVVVEDLNETIDTFKKNKVTTYAAHLKGDVYYSDGQFQNSSAIFIGNEGNGLSDQISKKVDKLIKIPMCGKVESLNAAVAAAILMYEAAKPCF